uniref:DM5 domain-containing protein n=1 Tax=Glossina austeni TaxID=7395 RepID=A0A1A9VQQ5_GLOAU
MRTFALKEIAECFLFQLLCLIAAAWADKLGYNYHPVAHSDSGLSFSPGSLGGGNLHGESYSSGSLHGASLGDSYSSGSYSGSSYHGGSVGGLGEGFSGAAYHGGLSGGLSGGYSGDFGVGSSGGGLSSGVAYDASGYQHAEYEKEFYTFTAPEHEFNDHHNLHKHINTVKKGVRVIFIKGPENDGLEDAAANLAKSAIEQKTAIYVLNKKADLSGLADRLNTLNTNINHKPEVHFVKYRTKEDAENAKKTIQSQYESLGGHSANYDGGETHVLNFASQEPEHVHTAAVVSSPEAAYLPSSIIKKSK